MTGVWKLYKEYPSLPPEDQRCVERAARDALKRVVAPAVVGGVLAWLPWQAERMKLRVRADTSAARVKLGFVVGSAVLCGGVGYHFVLRDFTRSILQLTPQSKLRQATYPKVLQFNPEIEEQLYNERVRRYRELQATQGAEAADAFLRAGGAGAAKPAAAGAPAAAAAAAPPAAPK